MPFILGGTKLRICVLWLLGVAGIAFSLVLPNEVGRLTQLFSAGGEVTWAPVQWALILLVGAQLALSAVSYLRKSSEAVLQERMVRDFTLAVFERTVRYPADFFRSHGVEKIIQRALQDTQIVVSFFLDVLVNLPIAALSVAGFGAYMIYHHAFLGICMIPLSLLTGYFIFFDKLIQRWNRKGVEAWDQIREEANELVSGISEVRSHAAFEHGLEGLRKSFADRRQPVLRVGKLTALFHAINPFVLSIQTGALYGLGAALCMRSSALADWVGPTTWGDVIRFALVAALFQRPMLELANHFLRWRVFRENIRRLREHLDTPCVFAAKEEGPLAPLSKGEIGFEDVNVVLPSGARILGTVDLTIRDGTHVGLAGLAGCGKSTLISLITREMEATSGRLKLGDRDAREVGILALARDVGFVSQKPVVFNATIRENILFGLRRWSRDAIRDARGPIDVGALPDVKDVAGIERELVRVVRCVGLDSDLFQKFLDLPLGGAPSLRPIREGIGALRAGVLEKLRGCDDRCIARFDRGEIMPGSVGDNLFGPEWSRREGRSDDLDDVQAALRETPVYATLLQVGFSLFQSEQALAVRVGRQAPQLLAYLSSQGIVDERDATALARSREGMLKEMTPRQQQALLGVALRCDLDRAEEVRGGGDLGKQILEARGKLHPGRFPWPPSWTPGEKAPFVPGLTVRENLLWGRFNPRVIESAGKSDALVRDVLADAGHLDAAILAGMESPAGDGGKNLSGGQRQKIAVARAVIKRPRVLILDEATANLDERSQAKIVDMIREEFRDRTVVSISHRLPMLREFDRVLVMDRGKVVQEGPYQELARQEGLFRDLLQQGGEAKAAPAAEGEPADVGSHVRRLLAQCPLFGHLSSDQLGFVEKVSRRIECVEGEVLFRRGDPGTELFIILEGEIEFVLEREGGAGEVVRAYGPGQAFGELALFGEGVRTLGARSRTKSVLCLVGREDLMDLISADSRIAVGLLQGISRMMIAITNKQVESGRAGEGTS